MAIRAVFAENLRRIRAQRGISQEALALKAGVERTYVGLLERKKSSPTIDMLEKLAKVLKVKPDELLRKRATKADGKSEA
jgi:transcriptional regulator with XRE-family HTH domain